MMEMHLPTDYNTPIRDKEGKYHLCRPVLISVSGGKNIAYIAEDGTEIKREIKREPLHRYRFRENRRNKNTEQK